MRVNAYLMATAILFATIGAIHGLRLWYEWPVTIGTWAAPPWFSWVGGAAAFVLCAWAIALRRSRT